MNNNTKRLIITELIVGILILAIDLISKAIVDATIPLGQSVVVIEGILSLTYVRNTGAAFSLLNDQMLFFYIITPISVAVLIYILVVKHKVSKLQNFAIVVTLAGILGNFYDRVFFQYVRDMIEVTFIKFPIWNVADMALCVGVGMIIFMLFLELINDNKIKKAKNKADDR